MIPRKSGVLRKKREFYFGWPERYFELSGVHLCYTYPNKNLQRTFRLTVHCGVEPCTVRGRPCFKLQLISNGTETEMVLRPPTNSAEPELVQNERDAWVRAIGDAIVVNNILKACRLAHR